MRRCHDFAKKKTPGSGTFLRRSWLLPLRLTVLLSLLCHLVVYLFIIEQRSGLLSLLVITHLVIAISLLRECQLSAQFYQRLDRMAAAQASRPEKGRESSHA